MKHSSAAIDFFRWTSAWVVALCHIRDHLFVGWSGWSLKSALADAFTFFIGMANVAVLMFFVISGYLVGGALFSRFRAGRADLGRYAFDRVTRLYVVFIPGLLLTLAAGWLQSRVLGDGGSLPSDEHSLATFVGNLAFLQSIAVPNYGGNYLLWSLAYEFWYYVAFPLCLLAWAGRSARARIASTVLLFGIALAFPLQLTTRFPVWLFGVAIAAIRLPRLGVFVTFPLFAVAAVLSRVAFRGLLWSDLLVGMAFALFLQSMLARESSTKPSTGFWARLNARLASWSYSLYVVHVPIYMTICVLWFGQRRSLGYEMQGARAITTYACVCAATLLLAWAFAQLTERHTNLIRSWLRSRGRRRQTASTDAAVTIE